MSLLALDDADPDDPWAQPADRQSGHVQRAEQHAGELADAAATALPRGCSEVSIVVAEGDSVEHAIAATDFQRSELVLVGSSRLVTGRRVFLGPAAARILRALHVPMVVVPRDYRAGIR